MSSKRFSNSGEKALSSSSLADSFLCGKILSVEEDGGGSWVAAEEWLEEGIGITV